MKKILFLPVILSLLFLSFGGSSGCGNKIETPTAADSNLQGYWVAERINLDGGRIVLGLAMDTQGIRHAGVMSVAVTGESSVISEGVYVLKPNNTLEFDFNELNNFQAIYNFLDSARTRMALGSDVYSKVTASNTDGPIVGGQVRINATTTASTVSSLTLSDSPDQVEEQAPERPYVPQAIPDVIVTYRDGHTSRVLLQPSAPSAAALTSSTHVSSIAALVDQQIQAAQEVQANITQSVEALRLDPNVLSVTPNITLQTQSITDPSDNLFDDQWNMRLLNVLDAWGQTVTSTNTSAAVRDVTVAVIDTGIVTVPHPADLENGVLWLKGYDFVDAHYWDGKASCSDSRWTEAPRWKDLSLDGSGPDVDPTDPQGNFHGTHVTGLIASGLDNGGMVGIAGAVPRVKVLPLRAMGRCGDGNLFDVTQAILYAAKILPNMGDCPFDVTENTTTSPATVSYTIRSGCTATTNPNYASRPKADIINLSLGQFMPYASDNPFFSAIQRAKAEGVMIIAAAGNQQKGPGWCWNQTSGAYERDTSCNFYPAADRDNVLAVGAVYPNLSSASYSNFTSQTVQSHFVVAPGGSTQDGILSTVRQDVSGGYEELVGTSQATPHVTGVAAMMMAVSPGSRLSVDQTRNMLESTAIPLNANEWDEHFGHGLLNPVGAIVAAKDGTTVGVNHLSLSASDLIFGPAGSQATIVATSGIGSTLSGLSVTTTTADGRTWLQATLSGTSAPARLNVVVNRTGLANGNYTGTINVTSSAGTQSIAVSMQVAPQSAAGGDSIENLRNAIERLTGDGSRTSATDIGEMFVLLIDPDTDQLVYYTTTDFQADYRFLMGVQPGRYYLKAGIDEDGDGDVCNPGGTEPCFVYPNSTSPQIIEVTATTRRINFVLGQ